MMRMKMSKKFNVRGIDEIDKVPHTEENKRKLANELVSGYTKEQLQEIVFNDQLETFEDEELFQICWDFTYNGKYVEDNEVKKIDE